MAKDLFIVTTYFNPNIQLLKQTLNSVLSQKNINIIHYLYDDGSKTSYHFYISKYINIVKRSEFPYKVIYKRNKKNKGVDYSHFYCFKQCASTFFMWLDVGDYLENGFVNKFFTFEKKHHNVYRWFHFNAFEFDDDGVLSKQSANYKRKFLLKRDQFQFYCFNFNRFFSSFIIDFDFYKTLNPTFYFVDKNEHYGFYYDAQITFLLAANHAPFYFFKNVFSYIYVDKHSISRAKIQGTTDELFCLMLKKLFIACPSLTNEDYKLFESIALLYRFQKTLLNTVINNKTKYLKSNIECIYYLYKKKYKLISYLYRSKFYFYVSFIIYKIKCIFRFK